MIRGILAVTTPCVLLISYGLTCACLVYAPHIPGRTRQLRILGIVCALPCILAFIATVVVSAYLVWTA